MSDSSKVLFLTLFCGLAGCKFGDTPEGMFPIGNEGQVIGVAAIRMFSRKTQAANRKVGFSWSCSWFVAIAMRPFASSMKAREASSCSRRDRPVRDCSRKAMRSSA